MSDETPIDEANDLSLTPPDLASLDPDRVRVDGTDPEPETPEEEKVTDDRGNEITELSDEERAQFRDLLTVGLRTKTTEVLGHTIVISSISSDDEIRIGTKVKEHSDSPAYSRAYQVGTIAASLQQLDGKPFYESIFAGEDPSVAFEARYAKVVTIHPLVAQLIYNEIAALDGEFAELAKKLGKL